MPAATATGSDLMAAVRGLSAARDLPPEVILEALRAALISAYHKIPERTETHVTVDINEHTGDSRVISHFTVVEEEFLEDPNGEMTVEQAREHKPDAKVGDILSWDVTPDDFGRIAAQTAKQVILQRIREAEREQTYSTYAEREGEIVYGTIQSINRDNITIALDRVEALLPKSGQIPGERYSPNQRLRVYVSEVKRSPKGPQVIVTRTHRDMLKRLMELEIPEIFQGIVEIKAIAREAGSRSKVSVWSHQEGVDPVGACVGMRGVRIQALVRELGGEKIDIVEWDPDPRVFIAHALSPARVMHVWLEDDSERRTANVIVPDSQLSLAIGREGQNARLAAKLTGWRIDIRAESEAGEVLDQVRVEEAERTAERARAAAELAAQAAPPPVAVAEPAVVVAAEAPPVAAPEAPAAEPAAQPAATPDHAKGVPERRAPTADEDEEMEALQVGKGKKGKAKKLVRDPRTGKMVAEKERKPSRRRGDWDAELDRWADEEIDDTLGFSEEDFLAGKDAGDDDADASNDDE
jgi:transcription termination/antitermination protein NusA